MAGAPRRIPMKGRPAGRVFMTADAVGGVWTYALDLAAGLGRSGVQTTLAVLGPSPSELQADAAEAVPGLTVIDTGLPLDWTAATAGQVREAGATVADLARAYEADIVHLNSPALAAAGGYPAPVIGACHSCLATWWSAVRDGPMPADFRWRTQALWRGLLACDALVAPTAAFADAVARAYEVPAPEVVRNGRTAVAAAESSPPEPVVFTAGRLWDEGKNIAVLDAAAAQLGAPLCAAGPTQGPNGAAVELHHVQHLGVLGPAEVQAWLARRPVYVTAALYEPFGLGVLEAAQAGCALVLSDIPTLRELWEGAAVFVEPRDADGFAAACRRLLADPAWRNALGRKARLHATRYTAAAMADGTLDVYRRFRPDLFAPASKEAAA